MVARLISAKLTLRTILQETIIITLPNLCHRQSMILVASIDTQYE